MPRGRKASEKNVNTDQISSKKTTRSCRVSDGDAVMTNKNSNHSLDAVSSPKCTKLDQPR